MVGRIRDFYGLNCFEVLDVMLQLPRHNFVPRKYRDDAYEDKALSIGYGQTISQPYTVAFMSSLLISGNPEKKKSRKRVLEIGTGSGYQAAVLSKFFDKVYTVEIISDLAMRARTVLARVGCGNVEVRVGNGSVGWKKYAPYEAIIITAGVNKVPDELFNQLKIGGILVAPVGKEYDKVMTRYKKQSKFKYKKEEFGKFNFVPFVKSKLYLHNSF